MTAENEFRKHLDDSMTTLYRELLSASDDYAFNVELNEGEITVRFARRPARVVITPHEATRQIWVSIQSKTFKLDWDVVENTFVLSRTGQTIKQLVEEALSRQLRDDVAL